MGTDMLVVLAIDDNSPIEGPRFFNTPSYWDLTNDFGLTGGKHYEFHAAIAGVRNETGLPPLIPPRGVPDYLMPHRSRERPPATHDAEASSPEPARRTECQTPSPGSNDLAAWNDMYPMFDGLCSSGIVGWLTLEEIGAAMRHHNLDGSHLDSSVLLVLDAMEAAERRYGRDRVHLVFGIE
ncbi:hypothetical protein [Paludisphaera sp.]|uniref:hypothetical protein n=1 Tax=Paludisphaera sp. TaxID=2017432 RepID=UPI00301C8C97